MGDPPSQMDVLACKEEAAGLQAAGSSFRTSRCSLDVCSIDCSNGNDGAGMHLEAAEDSSDYDYNDDDLPCILRRTRKLQCMPTFADEYTDIDADDSPRGICSECRAMPDTLPPALAAVAAAAEARPEALGSFTPAAIAAADSADMDTETAPIEATTDQHMSDVRFASCPLPQRHRGQWVNPYMYKYLDGRRLLGQRKRGAGGSSSCCIDILSIPIDFARVCFNMQDLSIDEAATSDVLVRVVLYVPAELARLLAAAAAGLGNVSGWDLASSSSAATSAAAAAAAGGGQSARTWLGVDMVAVHEFDARVRLRAHSGLLAQLTGHMQGFVGWRLMCPEAVSGSRVLSAGVHGNR